MIILGRRTRQLHSRENAATRASLPCPRPLPFLLIGQDLVCPWPRRPRGELRPEQLEQLAAVRALLAATRSTLPVLAWVSIDGGITAMPDPGGSWLARRMHDGQVVAAAG